MNRSSKKTPKTVVALYSSNYNLPLSIAPDNPYAIFCYDKHKDYIASDFIDLDDMFIREGFASKHFIFPILEGLQNLCLPNIMAHVSVNFDGKTKNLSTVRQTIIQITTEPHDWRQNDKNLPIIVTKEGQVTVKSLYSLDYGALNSIQSIETGSTTEEERSSFWTNFFLNKLREERVKAEQAYEQAKSKARLFRLLLNQS